jgi:hypothetical protein
MFRRLGLAIYRAFFWTYERGSWQYDVMVILILSFIFLTPRSWFKDQPQPVPSASDVVLLRNDNTQQVYQLSAALINTSTDGTLEHGAERVLSRFTGKPMRVLRIEASRDSSGQVVSYAVWVRQ